ncbi:MAG: allantoicase [Kofleriaceae bacterium]
MSDFRDLPELAGEAVGGAAIACNDEFFAEKDSLLRPHAAEWREHAYTDRGKWMDGWETRRYRPADGVAPGRDSDIHDWCVVRLGLPGRIHGIDVDTSFFRGNFPDSCAVEGAELTASLDLAELASAYWAPLVPRSELQGNHHNLFVVTSEQRFTHVRLRIYPDGGVARLRVHGEVVPRLDRLHTGLVDLAALDHGAVVVTCSDMFFGSRNNLIKAGPSRSMADGWETRRRRGPGHEWAIVRLAGAGVVERLELDTSHFKGNAPALALVEGGHGLTAEAIQWRPLLARTPMQPHTRHVFEHELRRIGEVTHLRLSVFPCGGVARLRAWGSRARPLDPGLATLNLMTPLDCTAALLRCCGSHAWAAAMCGARPFEDEAALVRIAERIWFSLPEAAHREAFAAHPKIGAQAASAWSQGEQASAANAEATTRAELVELNRSYEAKHGFIFIVCASGRAAADLLAELRARHDRDRVEELRTAGEEQAKIARLRLAKLLEEL